MQECVWRQGRVANCPVPGIQKGTAINQGTMQGVRSVRPEQAVIQPFSQMAAVPDRFQRTTTSREVAMDPASEGCMKTASIRQMDIPGTEKKYRPGPSVVFRPAVTKAVWTLSMKKENVLSGNISAITYCLEVIKACDHLFQKERSIRGQGHSTDKNREYMVTVMAPIYSAALNDALEEIQQHLAQDKNPREYYKKVNRLAIHVNPLSDSEEHFVFNDCKKKLCDIFRCCINNELNYLKYLALQTSPSGYAVKTSANVIDWLLGEKTAINVLSLMSKQEMKEIKDKRDELWYSIVSCGNNHIADREKEKPDVLKEGVPHGVTDKMVKLELFDKLKERLEEIKERTGTIPEDVQGLVCLLKELAELCDYFDRSGIAAFALCCDIKQFLASVIKKILSMKEDSVEDNSRLSEAMTIIGRLITSHNNWVGKNCMEWYMDCKQQEEGLREATVGTNKTREYFCSDRLKKISRYLELGTEDDYWRAADLLAQLLQDYGEDLTLEIRVSNRTRRIKSKLSDKLYHAIFDEYNEHRTSGKSMEEISSVMSCHKSRVIKLIPYVFVLKDEQTRDAWKHMACCVWYNDVERLRHAETFSKKDVDVLLYMKGLAPALRDYHNRYSNVIDAMKNFFRFTLRDQAATAFIEETVELSAWVDCLCHFYRIEELKALNEAWKQKYQGAASAKSMASSDALAEVMPAATAYPAIVDASMEAPGCHLHMERQPAPDMKPVTELVDTPVPAAWRSPWQSVSVACCTPMTPPSAANSLQSTPAKHFSLDHHEMLTGDQRHFPVHPHVQGFSAACGSVQSQSYMASQPQHPSQPMTSAECEAGYSQASRGIIEQVERQINALHMMRYNLSHVSIQGGEHQQQLPLVWCPDVNASHLDNDDAITGILHLLTAVKSYLQQKASELHVSISIHPPTNPWSKYYSVFKDGVDRLIEGMQQIVGSTMNQDAVYKLLMQLDDKESKSKIDKLFTNLKTNLKGKKSVEEDRAVLQKLDIIHKLLLSVDILIKSR